jgi:hypothetical protein
MSLQAIAAASGKESAKLLQMRLVDSVTHIGNFINEQGFDCGWQKAGTLSFS